VDFTREPIIETVITPKDGCKLVVRSSKSNGQEEHFVDALEVVSFGHSFFFRSQERPKTFLVPATDYEILEVREARMVLKNVGIDRAIKIGGGREAPLRTPKEPQTEKEEVSSSEGKGSAESEAGNQSSTDKGDGRLDKKRDRRRNARRRRGKEGSEEEAAEGETAPVAKESRKAAKPAESGNASLAQQVMTTSILTSLLPPPPTLISETIARYKDNAMFKDAFYSKEEKVAATTAEDFPVLPQPEYGSFEISEEEEEQIYQQRQKQKGYSDEEKGEEHSDSDESHPHPETANGNSHDQPQSSEEPS
jgi:hypothetical protein